MPYLNIIYKTTTMIGMDNFPDNFYEDSQLVLSRFSCLLPKRKRKAQGVIAIS